MSKEISTEDDDEEELEEEPNDQDYETIKSFPVACLTPGSFTDWDRLQNLVSNQTGASAVTPGATEQDFSILLDHLRKDGVEDPELPSTLTQFYRMASTFKFYELVTFAATEACTSRVLLEYIFGDEELRQEAGVEVAKPGWIGWGATGDNYGMILINCDAASPYFGQVWNYINNQNVENKMVECLDTLLERIVHLLEWNDSGKQSLKLEYGVFNASSNLTLGL